jgi:hypothetical protein
MDSRGIQTWSGCASGVSYMFSFNAGRPVKIQLKRDHCVPVQDKLGRGACTLTNMLLEIRTPCQAPECGIVIAHRYRLHICETYMSATEYKCRGGCHVSLRTLSIRIKKEVLLTALYDLFVSGRAIAQAVSRRLPTAAARVRARIRSRGICG